MKKLLPLFMFLVLIHSLYACGKWKVRNLSSSVMANIKAGKNVGEVSIKADDYALQGLTFKIGIFENNICIADNGTRRLTVFDKKGQPELIIGSINKKSEISIPVRNFNFSVIGTFAMNDKGYLFVQNRLSSRVPRKTAKESRDFTPSYILVFDKKGNLQYTLGQRGTPDIPFYYIEKLEIDDNGRLIVISRSFDTWTIYRFSGKRRDLVVNLDKLVFEDKEGEDIYKGKIENIRLYGTGDKILLSVAYYHELRLKYRKIFHYAMNEGQLERNSISIPDPKNVLFNFVDDKHIYLWDMERKDVRFQVRNIQGKIINNVSLNFDDEQNIYSHILADRSGEIFSYHVRKEGIKINSWD